MWSSFWGPLYSIRNIHTDLIRKRQQEFKYLSRISFNDFSGSGEPDNLLWDEIIGTEDDFTSEVDSRLDVANLQGIIFEEVCKILNELQRMVALYDLEFMTEAEFRAYVEEHVINDSAIRVARYRYRQILGRSKLVKYRNWLR